MSQEESQLQRQKRSILVADDDLMFRTVASELVRSWGYDCFTAVDGNGALQLLQQKTPPTIAILDWLMPGITGTEVCRLIRASDPRQYTYFILVSARDRKQDSIEGLRSGADTYINKPLDAEELRAKLEIANRILLMEESLRDLHAETELFINSVPSILIGTDHEGKITRWNSGAQAIFGVDRQNAREQPLSALPFWGKDSGTERDLVDALKSGLTCQLSLPFYRDEEQRLVGLTIHPLRSHIGALVGSIVIGADVTERRIAEDQLRQTQKLEAIGQLAAGIAHEINTPTQFVGDNLSFLEDLWPAVAELLASARLLGQSSSASSGLSASHLADFQRIADTVDLEYLLLEVPRAISESHEGLQRTRKIVQAMKEFSHRGSNEKRDTDINAAIQMTITVSRSEWRYVADVVTDLDPNLPTVPCVVDHFNQAMLNIIVNAAHAIGDVIGDREQIKGRIAITTRRDGDAVVIQVADTGGGIPEEIRSRVFEPFFSTKQVGKGTGQGLALAHSAIVKEHEGKIWFESEAGKGTTFYIRLPLATALAAAK
jgi:PAS domain S-box-containing protein